MCVYVWMRVCVCLCVKLMVCGVCMNTVCRVGFVCLSSLSCWPPHLDCGVSFAHERYH